MGKLRVAPTKSNLLSLKEQFGIAREGFELLEQKREILVMELMRRVEETKLLERSLDKRVASAYPALRSLLVTMGRDRASETAKGIVLGHAARERRVQAAGMTLLDIDFEAAKPSLPYSFGNSFAVCDKTMIEFTELLSVAARLAAIRSMVWKLSQEVRKTQRRVNALEKMVIPDTGETIRYVESVLEEREREGFFTQKLIKAGRKGDDGA
jgi:V/A-type H+/Na+-transporting ATPase subunit D